ncbi:MAG TPA: DNA primase [Polyangiales bacterium]|nr:DNA primase [Polyangiales bacterium]
MISDELIAEIRDRTDIVTLIGEFVELKQRGANFVGLCPFHSEKSPSFNVRRDRQFFHCFGCQESGDAMTFLMRLEGLTFPQAARALAERAGVEIKEVDDREDAERRRERQLTERLCAVTEAAAAFYVEQLLQEPETGPAHRELMTRMVNEETAGLFRLGYAPASWDALTLHLEHKGHSLRDAEALGLIVPKRSGKGYYDRFRHRLMFPVTDLHGRVIAFSGRLLPPTDPANTRPTEEPKYVNSPESAIYKKGALLFGLHHARVEIRRNGWAILCEGNFDLVALHQAGFRNAVAPLGTAFTDAQARLLRRFAQRVTLMFDADTAGRKAVTAAMPLLRASELSARVAPLPNGADPDSFLRQQGAAALRTLVDSAPGIVEYLIDSTAESVGNSAAERANAIASLGPVVAAVGNPVEVELYIQRIARRFSISELRVVKDQLRQGVQAARQPQRQTSTATKLAPRPGRVKLPELQSGLLGAFLDKPALFRSQYAENLKELLTVEELQSIFSAAAAQFADRGTLDAPRLLAQLAGNPALDWLKERLSVEMFADDARAEEELRSGIPLLAKQNIESELPRLAQRAQLAWQRGDEMEARTLTRQHLELSKHASQLVKGVKR